MKCLRCGNDSSKKICFSCGVALNNLKQLAIDIRQKTIEVKAMHKEVERLRKVIR